MKNFNLTTRLILTAMVSVLAIACKKNATEDTYPPCPYTVYSVMAPPNIYLDIRDKQGRDLLLPTTPGHYDTAQIRQLNAGLVKYIPKVANGYRIRMVLDYKVGETTSYLKLSATDQDTVYTNYEDNSTRCSVVHILKTFKYNGNLMADSAYHQFTVIK